MRGVSRERAEHATGPARHRPWPSPAL